jgi:paraquat-inducible protein B
MTGEELPKARIRRRRLFRLVWVVPVVALAVAAWLIWEHMRSLGPEIAIRFNDASGLRVGQTPVNYRGVQIGEVSGIELSKDHKQAVVKARLHRAARSIATEGAQFWIVRPQLGLSQVTGLSTVLSGPEIHVLPGKGETSKKEFTGLDNVPIGVEASGLRLVLRAERPKGIRVNTPVNYRGVEVGMVHRIELAPNSASADIHILIRSRYAPLVRAGSAFWNTSGVHASGGILKGIELELESLRTLFTGSIEFATPSETAPRVKPGTVFFLHDKPKDEWLNWQAKIPLGAAQGKTSQQPAAPDRAAGN